MKKVINVSVLFLSMVLIVACGGKSKSITDPSEYTNTLMTIVNSSDEGLSKIKTAIESDDYASAEVAIKEWTVSLDQKIEEVKSVGDFNGNSAIKDASVETLKNYKSAAENYKKLVEMYVAQKDGKEIDANLESELWNKIQETLEGAGQTMNDVLEKFHSSL